jgi:hypothetical protein
MITTSDVNTAYHVSTDFSGTQHDVSTRYAEKYVLRLSYREQCVCQDLMATCDADPQLECWGSG